MLSMIILNETIRAELIVFIAIFADVATVCPRVGPSLTGAGVNKLSGY
jgi:hypothetical protein